MSKRFKSPYGLKDIETFEDILEVLFMSNMVKKGVIPGNSRIRLPKDKFPPGEFYKIEQLDEKSFKFTIVEDRNR